ncbi:hypothetical protein, partial [Methylobacterium brachythecii]|uniref:hypothetical protein n=1 Tax=Methylobacterium brachythecii TaxID=1176177 RepID=UPI0024E16C0C
MGKSRKGTETSQIARPEAEIQEESENNPVMEHERVGQGPSLPPVEDAPRLTNVPPPPPMPNNTRERIKNLEHLIQPMLPLIGLVDSVGNLEENASEIRHMSNQAHERLDTLESLFQGSIEPLQAEVSTLQDQVQNLNAKVELLIKAVGNRSEG